MIRPNGTSWEDLIRIEPRLKPVECFARQHATRLGEPPDWKVWDEVKQRLRRLVGWDAMTATPAMQTSEVWDVCYERLLQVWEGGE